MRRPNRHEPAAARVRATGKRRAQDGDLVRTEPEASARERLRLPARKRMAKAKRHPDSKPGLLEEDLIREGGPNGGRTSPVVCLPKIFGEAKLNQPSRLRDPAVRPHGSGQLDLRAMPQCPSGLRPCAANLSRTPHGGKGFLQAMDHNQTAFRVESRTAVGSPWTTTILLFLSASPYCLKHRDQSQTKLLLRQVAGVCQRSNEVMA